MNEPDVNRRFIDVHHHVVLPEYERALVRSGAADPSRPRRKNSDPETACAAMAELGIERALINPLSVAGVHHGDDADARYLTRSVNEALARFVAHAPQKLGFFATLPFPDIDGALAELEYALDVLHADGIILLSNQNGLYVGDRHGEALYAEMDRRGAVAFIHPARPSFVDLLGLKLWPAVIEYPFDTTRVAATLIYNGYMRQFTAIKWVLAHAGGTLPYLSLRLRLMEESDEHRPTFVERMPEGVALFLDKFYFDTAIAGSRAAMSALYEIADPSHVLYGTDWPYIDRRFVADQIDNLTGMSELAGARFDAMARGNALTLFKRFA
jgi:predicted TIM-barrel fold metal-dependent hydrolase